MTPASPHVWLRGPVDGVPPLLQPAAHALLQTREDVRTLAAGLPLAALHARPGGSASVAFHLLHLAGATHRLFTYARGDDLSDTQRTALAQERSGPDPSMDAESLVRLAEASLDLALAQLRTTPESQLLVPRRVGAAGLPSTVLGLLFHGAEHAARHAGQIATLVRVVDTATI